MRLLRISFAIILALPTTSCGEHAPCMGVLGGTIRNEVDARIEKWRKSYDQCCVERTVVEGTGDYEQICRPCLDKALEKYEWFCEQAELKKECPTLYKDRKAKIQEWINPYGAQD